MSQVPVVIILVG